ncbi:hypothetical protein N2152v2_003675 [Parachlorella kessleri]
MVLFGFFAVSVVTGAPAAVFLREDAFTVDQKSSLEQYSRTAVQQRGELLQREVSWLKSHKTDLIVSDIVPLACVAARLAGLPCVCVSNFSWDFIYSEYLTEAGSSEFRQLVWQIAEDYACAAKLLRLPGYVPMPAFRQVVDVPLVVRHASRPRQQVRAELGLAEDSSLAVFIYGGQPPGKWHLEEATLPPGWTCVVCSAGRPPGGVALPANFRLAAEDAYTPDLIAAADCVVGKIGYGTASECLAHSVPLVFQRRDFFNEEAFLRKLLEASPLSLSPWLLQVHNAAVEMRRRDFVSGQWAPYLQRAKALKPCYREPTNGAEVVAGLLEEAAREWRQQGQRPQQQGGASGRASPAEGGASLERAGSTRLRDTIVWGYMMQRHAARDKVEVPEWYTLGQLPPTTPETAPAIAASQEGHAEVQVARFSVVEASCNVASFPDTLAFLSLLSHLDDPPAAEGALELPERRAARGLFSWEEEVVVCRAPGRLDVMGGIADYSGSLVLQMPLQEACHVAVQRVDPARQRLWKHMEARQQREAGSRPDSPAGGESRASPRRPALRVVSFNADDTNRGPSFDMDLSDLRRGGRPMTYAEAREYFKSDPALSWAAYIAGALVVLQLECGAEFKSGLSILVHSDVPEGKGVSSSAAVEVATMSAVAAAHSIQLGGRQLALLCQKVENLVVGAPCGVMDQMASALGREERLLALRCQPAEVQGTVAIPHHIKFWGVDSGIRHSVGGSDYGAVRVGTFMGLRIVSQLAAEQARRAQRSAQAATAPSAPGGGASPAGGAGSASASRQPQLRQQQEGLLEEEEGFGPRASRSASSAGGRASEVTQLASKAPSAEGVPAVGGGYLANVAPSQFAQDYELRLPDELGGAAFLEQYGSHWDGATCVDPGQTYAVRTPAGHPIHENFRVHAFRQVLLGHPPGSGPSSWREQLGVLGELMYQSHASYSRCGLGSQGTDRLVQLVRQHHDDAVASGEEPALFGAKITGGGCGGTVCILGLASDRGEEALQRVITQYGDETGYQPKVFMGSSAGAVQFGHIRLRRTAAL